MLDKRKSAVNDKIESERKKIKESNNRIKEYNDKNKKFKKDLKEADKNLKKSEKNVKLAKKQINDSLKDINNMIKDIDNKVFKKDGKRIPKSELKSNWEELGVNAYLKEVLDNFSRLKKSYKETSSDLKRMMDEGFILKGNSMSIAVKDLQDNAYHFLDSIENAEQRQKNPSKTNFIRSPESAHNIHDLCENVLSTRVVFGENSEKDVRKYSKERTSLDTKIQENNTLINNHKKNIEKSKSVINDLEDELKRINSK